jgi:hypothetical protein
MAAVHTMPLIRVYDEAGNVIEKHEHGVSAALVIDSTAAMALGEA